MAHGGLLRAPYAAVIGLIKWADGNWPFIDGMCLMNSVHIEEFLAPRFVHVIAHLFVQDNLDDEDVSKQKQKIRGIIMAQFEGREPNEFDYDSQDEYGMSNDSVGWETSDEPLPYIAPLEPTEDGYPGLDPPMG